MAIIGLLAKISNPNFMRSSPQFRRSVILLGIDYNEDIQDFWFQFGGADYFILLQLCVNTGLLDQGIPMRNSNGEIIGRKTMCLGLWRPGRTCVDYIVFTRPLQAVSAERWLDQVTAMRALGICDDTSFGVVTVRGSWGFFQIPAAGFPEMKITFFQSGKEADRVRLLRTLANILEME